MCIYAYIYTLQIRLFVLMVISSNLNILLLLLNKLSIIIIIRNFFSFRFQILLNNQPSINHYNKVLETNTHTRVLYLIIILNK